jgi:hypothetical protein
MENKKRKSIFSNHMNRKKNSRDFGKLNFKIFYFESKVEKRSIFHGKILNGKISSFQFFNFLH